MEVHIVLYHWCTDEEEGTDIVGAYADYERACAEMHRYMRERRESLEEDYDHFDSDFAQDEKSYVSFGFYGSGYGMDHSWSGRVETVHIE